MGFIEVAHVSHVLPDGRVLLDDVSFRIGEGPHRRPGRPYLVFGSDGTVRESAEPVWD